MADLRTRAWTADQMYIESQQMVAQQKRQADQTVREQIFKSQLIYSPLIFSIVVFIVIAGVIFSGLQSWRDFRHGAANASSLKITRNGIEISSSVVGLLTLMVSFGFFYIYIIEIYKITDTSLQVISGKDSTEPLPKSLKNVEAPKATVSK